MSDALMGQGRHRLNADQWAQQRGGDDSEKITQRAVIEAEAYLKWVAENV